MIAPIICCAPFLDYRCLMTDSHSDGVLFAFSVEPRHDRATLERYLRLYPELAEDLIDLAHELRMVEGLGPSEQVVDSDDTARAAWREYAAAASPKATFVVSVPGTLPLPTP